MDIHSPLRTATAELAIALLVALAGLWIFFAANSIELPPIVVDPIGPIFWPKLLAITVILLASAYAVRVSLSLLRRTTASLLVSSTEDIQQMNYSCLLGTLVLLILYLVGLELLGYYISTPLFVLSLLLLLGVRSWAGLLVPTIGLVLIWGLLFQKGLGVPLPEGILL